jgi:hypothetical protein
MITFVSAKLRMRYHPAIRGFVKRPGVSGMLPISGMPTIHSNLGA